MTIIDLSHTFISGTEPSEWFAIFSDRRAERADRGIEFLTMATEEGNSSIPNAHRYTLPPGLEPKHLSAKQAPCLRHSWGPTRNNKPWSIRMLDQLRENPDSVHHFDFLRPVSYDGTVLPLSGIPYNSPFLKSLAYLTASIIAGGYQSQISKIVKPANLPTDVLEKKIEGLVTTTDCKKCMYTLKKCYTYVLTRTGMGSGRFANVSYKELGTAFLDNLINWMLLRKLSEPDTEHVKQVLACFIEGIVDHRRDKKGKVRTSSFKVKATRDSYKQLVENAASLAYPNSWYFIDTEEKQNERRGKGTQYYSFYFYIPKEVGHLVGKALIEDS